MLLALHICSISPITVSAPDFSLPMLSFFLLCVFHIPYLVATASLAVGVLGSCWRLNAYCNSIILLVKLVDNPGFY